MLLALCLLAYALVARCEIDQLKKISVVQLDQVFANAERRNRTGHNGQGYKVIVADAAGQGADGGGGGQPGQTADARLLAVEKFLAEEGLTPPRNVVDDVRDDPSYAGETGEDVHASLPRHHHNAKQNSWHDDLGTVEAEESHVHPYFTDFEAAVAPSPAFAHPYYTDFTSASSDAYFDRGYYYEGDGGYYADTVDNDLYKTDARGQRRQTGGAAAAGSIAAAGAAIEAMRQMAAGGGGAPGAMQAGRTVGANASVTASVLNGFTLFVNPQASLNLLVNRVLAFVVVQFMWFWLHFLFWDYTETLPAEEYSNAALLRFLASTDIAAYNQFIIWATAFFVSVVFLIPPVILNTFPSLQGKKRKKRSWKAKREEPRMSPKDTSESSFASFVPLSRHARNSPTLTNTSITVAWRRILCPICIARILAFNTLTFIGTALVWLVSPYFRPQGVTLPSAAAIAAAAGRKKKKRKRRKKRSQDYGFEFDPSLVETLEDIYGEDAIEMYLGNLGRAMQNIDKIRESVIQDIDF